MFESQYNYVPNPYPPRDMQPVYPGPGIPPGPPSPPWPGPGPIPPTIYVDPTLSVPGAAADAHVVGTLLAAKLSLDKLQGSIKLINDKLELAGIVDAATGLVPSKGADGSIEWVDAARASDITSIRNELQSISSEIRTINSYVSGLFDENADRKTEISDLNVAVNQLKELINGKDGQPGILERIESLETTAQALTEQMETKLDSATFNEFLDTVINGQDGLVAHVSHLEGCCDDVQALVNNFKKVLGDDPNQYEELYGHQPIYMTLNELKNMDIDGGDLDEEVEP